MSVVIPEGAAQVSIPFANASLSRPAQVVFGVVFLGGDAIDAANNILFAFVQSIGGGVDSNVTIGPATIRIGQDPGDPVVATGTLSDVGGGIQLATPANVALLFRKLTGLGGRAHRGRMYVPWALNSAVVNEGGFIEAATVASYAAVAADLLTELTTLGHEMVLLHDSTSPDVTPTLVTNLVPDGQVATQRRRLGR